MLCINLFESSPQHPIKIYNLAKGQVWILKSEQKKVFEWSNLFDKFFTILLSEKFLLLDKLITLSIPNGYFSLYSLRY